MLPCSTGMTRRVTVNNHAFAVEGPRVGNSLSPKDTTSLSLTCFMQRLKTLLFQHNVCLAQNFTHKESSPTNHTSCRKIG